MSRLQSNNISPSEGPKSSLGQAPALLAKRAHAEPIIWCSKPTSTIEHDTWCDVDYPKTITYKDVNKATTAIRNRIPVTPLVRSKYCVQLGLEVNYKLEIFHKTGSFHERSAIYCLKMLNDHQREEGIYSASMGNWAMALSYYGQQFKIPITIIVPANTELDIVEKCQNYGAKVIQYGKNLADAKTHAFALIAEAGKGSYLNGYDHPHAIAAAGSIGVEILEQMPKLDAILIPIGGGGLIAGIATVVKHLKPEVLIYGIESDKCCSFFKAMENELPYQTEVSQTIAGSLAVPTAGYNAFHTAQSLIDKLVLVDDDWIARAMLHLVEEEKVVVEGAGAASLSALLSTPNVLPELHDKTVVCVITGGNVDNYVLPRVFERAKAIEGRIIKVTVTLSADDMKTRFKVFTVIANVGASILQTYTDKAWLQENDFETIYITLICEVPNLKYACTLKHVMHKFFPNMCDFLEEPFSPIPICTCLPKRCL